MPLKGCSVIFVNSREQILLLLRDDIPAIAYPGMWDIPGGRVEPGETPWACIIREMNEEMGLDLYGHRLFRITRFTDRTEFTFWKSQEIDIARIHLTEGQALRWFTREEAENTPLAFNFNDTVAAFFNQAPYRSK